MKRTFLAAVAAFLLVAPMAHAFGGSWICENQMDMDQDEAWDISGHVGMFRIASAYRERWDAQYMRQQCEAFVLGRPYDISCLDDRRDWEAIKQSIPSDLFGMSVMETRPFYLELQAGDNGIKSAIDYCRDVGAIN